jgi:hypothetical protein
MKAQIINGKWFLEIPTVKDEYELLGPFESEKEALAYNPPKQEESKKKKQKTRPTIKSIIDWNNAA